MGARIARACVVKGPLMLLTAWAAGALYFDFPMAALRIPFAILYAIGMVSLLVFISPLWRQTALVLAGFAIVLCWWLTLKPRQDRNWSPNMDRTAWAEIAGDAVTVNNVRNFDYRSATDYTAKWETRTVRVSKITGIDLFINYWGSPWIAHPIVSFQFADAPPLAFSIETRREIGEDYSAIAGFYRQFELIYIVADERDVIRLRTNFLKEDVYLYHLTVPADLARERFLEYMDSLNALHARPRWYNAATSNCTTAIRAQHPEEKRWPWDWRILLNGKADEMLYERGALSGNLPFAELKKRAHINGAAQAAGSDPDFSTRIRAGNPGFTQTAFNQ